MDENKCNSCNEEKMCEQTGCADNSVKVLQCRVGPHLSFTGRQHYITLLSFSVCHRIHRCCMQMIIQNMIFPVENSSHNIAVTFSYSHSSRKTLFFIIYYIFLYINYNMLYIMLYRIHINILIIMYSIIQAHNCLL